MLDITPYILDWVHCCRDIWDKWFSVLKNGSDEFIEVENALFSSLVLSQTKITNRPNLNECYKLLEATYNYDIAEQRSICSYQKSGNIFCINKDISISKGSSYPIKSIDFMGTMLNDEPYVEIWWNENNFLLEQIKNVSISI